jgi:translation initiation factor IF-1
MVSNQKDVIQKKGVITEALPSATFRAKLETGEEVLTHLSGKMRLNRIRVLVGDEVTIEFSPYDQSRGRITFRTK